jgi:hypothetical protein
MLGVLSVRDDGTCQVGSYCNVTDNGIATATKDKTAFLIFYKIFYGNIVLTIFPYFSHLSKFEISIVFLVYLFKSRDNAIIII